MYVIIGANGYLGSYVIKAILEKTNEDIIATARDLDRVYCNDRVRWVSCDVQDDDSVHIFLKSIKEYTDQKIIYLAAYHHPDMVEQNRRLAWDINVTSLSKFINKCTFAKKFFYASTDSVYGESVGGYHFMETDQLKPVNSYGHNKCAAEAITVHAGGNVVRFPFLISPSLVYKPHFYDIIVDNIRAGKTFEMYEDSYRSSLSFENAGKLLIDLVEKDSVSYIINICGDRDLSKFDVGIMIAERERVNTNSIIPISIDTSQENFKVKRATSTLMDNSLLKKTLGLKQIDIFDNPI